MTLKASEFIRRFLLHILPRGLHKIRYYGLLATRNRKTRLAKARAILGQTPIQTPAKLAWQDLLLRLTGIDPLQCPCCKKGKMHTRQILQAGRAPPQLLSKTTTTT